MNIQFLGAAQTVTGSRTLLSRGKTRILVDAGLFQGYKHLRLKNREPFPIPVEEISAILLTHAHLDHSGYLPVLVKNGFRGKIFATPATIDLCRVLLTDSGHLQEEEANYANRHSYSKHQPALPLYTVQDAEATFPFFSPVEWNQPIALDPAGAPGWEATFYPAGHLLGAASIVVRVGDTRVGFSGDLGRKQEPLIGGPQFAGSCQHLVLESTYGNRLHPDTDPESQIQEIILKTIRRGGQILIPAFSVGRAQLILYYLLRLKQRGAIPDELPVYLNSPMAAQANVIFSQHAKELRIPENQLRSLFRSVRVIEGPLESKALVEMKDPAIIIAGSGMATGGRVIHHLKTILPDPKNTVLFAGYQAGGTRGAQMVDGAEKVKIHGTYWPVQAEILNLSHLSAHADTRELIDWIQQMPEKPRQIFVNHGENDAADALRLSIEEKLRIRSEVPEIGKIYELD